MAFSYQTRNKKKRQTISEINITPFVDVLLVLLIIFMISAPTINGKVDVNLPKGVKDSSDEKVENVSVSIKSDGAIYLQDELTKFSYLAPKLKEITSNNFSNKVFVRADKALDYGKVMEVVREISVAGFSQVVLVTETKND